MIIQDKTYPEMYYATYPDGTPSADFYNKSRAKEHSLLTPELERESKVPMDRRHSAQRPQVAL